MKLFGMRKASVAEPELFVQSFGVDNEGVAFPLTSRVSVIQGIRVIAAKISLLRSSVGIDEMPIVIAASGHHKNSSESFLLQKLIPIRHLKLAHGSGRLAREKHRVIF